MSLATHASTYCPVQHFILNFKHGYEYHQHFQKPLSFAVVGEKNPALTLRINNNGIQNVLELAVQHKLQVGSQLLAIAVFSGTRKSH
eukprot:scaffold313875_cov14-Tisochrysis_lutea.AAC.1